MRMIRYILAVIVGTLASITVWLWPQRPLWCKAFPSNVSRLSIHLVGDKLTAVGSPDHKVPGSDKCHILICDAKTGKSQQDFEMMMDGPMEWLPQVATDLNSVLLRSKGWSIYDLATGQRRYEQSDSLWGGRDFSPNGNWFCTTRRQSGKLEDFLQLRSLNTGEVVHEFLTPSGYHQAIPLFSPNSDSVCIFWEERQNNWEIRANARKLISIYEVPSGKEIVHVELPKNRLWFGVRNWDGETLLVFELTRESTQERYGVKCLQWKPFRSASIEEATIDSILGNLETNRLQDKNFAQWLSGADWAVGWEMLKPGEALGKWYDQLREWIINRLKIDINGKSKWRVSCYTRSDGNLRLEFPNLSAMPITISDDGHLLYAYREGEPQGPWTLEVWDLYPPARWPWSLLAGISGVALILLPGYWRSKQKDNKPTSFHIIGPNNERAE